MTGYNPQITQSDRRIIIVGGPMAGKSTLARQLRWGYPTFCGDPRSKARLPETDVTYLPEGLSWSAASQYIVSHWLTMPGPWVLEGHVMARVLRKHLAQQGTTPADRILVIPQPHPAAYVTPAQAAMNQAVLTTWNDIAPRLAGVEYLSIGDAGWSPDLQELTSAIDTLTAQPDR